MHFDFEISRVDDISFSENGVNYIFSKSQFLERLRSAQAYQRIIDTSNLVTNKV